jgi:hypothetical protein
MEMAILTDLKAMKDGLGMMLSYADMENHLRFMELVWFPQGVLLVRPAL